MAQIAAKRVPKSFDGRVRQTGHNRRVIHRNYEPAMTFEEIGAALGYSRKMTWMIYARAMEKIRQEIRQKPHIYETAMGLTRMLSEHGTTFPDWSI